MTRKLDKRSLPIILLLLLMPFGSCDSNRVFEEHVALNDGVWNVNNKIRFDVAISELSLRYNFYLNVRNDREYPYSNLYLFMNTVFPDGRITRDTVELTLADYDGRWLGSGMGSVKFSRFLFKSGVRFTLAGNYRFVFEQAMRMNDLKGIRDMGIRLEKQ